MEATQPARPRAGHVFITRIVPGQTESGLILSLEKEETTFTGVLIAIGPDAKPDCAVGEKVLFQPWRSDQLDLEDGRKVFSVPVKDILGVLDEDDQ